MDDNSLRSLLWIWGFILLPLLYVVSRRPGSGLVAAYCFQMWMLYWLGAMIHVLPWSELPDTEYVVLGFQQATWGIAAFAAGAILLGPVLGRTMLGRGVPETLPEGFEVDMDPANARRYIRMGLISYFILAPTVGRISGLNGVSAAASQLVVSGCCLQAWIAWHRGGKAALLRTMPQTFLIPMVTLVKQGFMSYGVLAISTIMLFVAQFFRPRWILFVGFAVGAYMGLTVYVSYMRDRTEIRSVVWTQDRSTLDKLKAGGNTLATLDAFDWKNQDQLGFIDDRLNQNGLVGTAVDNLMNGGEFLKGETIKDALLAMIPRLIWRDKPITAGSGGLAAKLTGLEFASGTSVGVGPVLEFYGNFGTIGVVFGFFFFGALVSGLDFGAGVHLRLGNWTMFTSCFLVGISCLNVSGSLVEITMGAMASLVVATVVRRRERKVSYTQQETVEATAQ